MSQRGYLLPFALLMSGKRGSFPIAPLKSLYHPESAGLSGGRWSNPHSKLCGGQRRLATGSVLSSLQWGPSLVPALWSQTQAYRYSSRSSSQHSQCLISHRGFHLEPSERIYLILHFPQCLPQNFSALQIGGLRDKQCCQIPPLKCICQKGWKTLTCFSVLFIL